MAVNKLTKEAFEREVLQSDKPVLIDFYADWCGPCQMVSPLVDEIAEENPQIKVYKVNVDEQPALAQTFQVTSIPMLAVLKNGKITARTVGAKPKDAILQLFAD